MAARGLSEGAKKGAGLRAATGDLCEVPGIEPTAARQADLAGRDLAVLAVLRAHLKAHRSWP